MSELELIAPQQETRFAFAVEPAYNALCSLVLLNSPQAGFGEWVANTASKLSPELKETNKLVCNAASRHLGGEAWPSFPRWVDSLAEQDPYQMRDFRLEDLLWAARMYLGDGAELPSTAQLLEDRAAFFELMARLYRIKQAPFDRAEVAKEYELYQAPLATKEMMINHLRLMWNEYLEREWQQTVSLIRDSVAAFESLDLSGSHARDILHRITARNQLPVSWHRWLPGADKITIIPSAHIGPYMLVMDHEHATVRIVVRARIPEGSTVSSPELSRSELLMRLSALSDDTRLRILDLLAREGEKSAKDIMTRLNLTQSSTSRHLRQLGATGYLEIRSHEGTKFYHLDPQRIDKVFSALKRYLRIT
jgi:DNA-binding transcriptional ArsR family regulator